MMRKFVALSLFACLSACGSGGTGPVIGAIVEEVGGLLPRDERVKERSTPVTPVTRGDIDRANVAAIWGRLESDPVPSLLYAASANRGYVTYLSNFGQQITLRGSQITGTRGIGTDLLSSWSEGADPLSRPISPGSWPASVTRFYELPAVGPRGSVLEFNCLFERGQARELVILEIRHRGIEFSETCTGPWGSFENLHFADVNTGFVWRSLQWTGPDVDLIDLQILEPLTSR